MDRHNCRCVQQLTGRGKRRVYYAAVASDGGITASRFAVAASAAIVAAVAAAVSAAAFAAWEAAAASYSPVSLASA